MHGFSVAEGIFKLALAKSRKEPSRRVVEIRVRVGRGLFHSDEELLEAWKITAKGTELAHARLSVDVCDGRDCVLDRVLFD